MQKYWKKTLIALSCASVLLLTACSDDDKEIISVVVYDSYLSEKKYTLDGLTTAADINVMRYRMPNVVGESVDTTALVLTPKTPRPKDGWRVVVWNHGTVGSGDSCAPSLNILNPRFKTMAESLLQKGYVIVAPDYEGLGTRGVHPYLHLNSAAQSNIYAMKAYKERYRSLVHGQWMTVGQSQGGHASLGTAEFAQTDRTYKGAVAAAPASSLGVIITQVAPALLEQAWLAEQAGQYPAGATAAAYAELLAYAAYVVVGIKAYDPSFDYKSVFHSRSQPIVAQAEGTTGDNGLCLTPLVATFAQDIMQFLAANPGKAVLDYPGLVDNFENNPVIKKFLTINQPATQKINTPVMIIQGELDMAVPLQITQALANLLTGLGTPVTFVPVAGAGHTAAIVEKNAELVAFVEQHMPAQ